MNYDEYYKPFTQQTRPTQEELDRAILKLLKK